MEPVTTTKTILCGTLMLFYPAALPRSSPTPTYTASLIRRHRAPIGPPWRKPNPAQQALPVLACPRNGETSADLAAGFGIGIATAWRYVTQTAGLLAARSLRPRAALAQARRAGHAYLIIDGTSVPIDRVAQTGRSTAAPAPRPHALDAETGRGLEIVALLTDQWGFYHPTDGGKVVWAALVTGTASSAPHGAGT